MSFYEFISFKKRSYFNLFICTLFSVVSWTYNQSAQARNEVKLDQSTWTRFENYNISRNRSDYTNGISYILSGTLAVIGGFVGDSLSQDPLEKGVYTAFQTIGIASIGYGASNWKIGSDERMLFDTIKAAEGLDEASKSSLVRSYYQQKAVRESNQKLIKAITHGMIAALNFYSASQQKNESIKNTLLFFGGVNLLATISYSF
jgi:hypothetical protein